MTDRKQKPAAPTLEMFAVAPKLPRFTESVTFDLSELDEACELDAAFERITNLPPPAEPSVPSLSELPTPHVPPRDTQRPDDATQQALQYVSRTGVGWLEQPRWSYDIDIDCILLIEPYLATALDEHLNRFAVRCEAGITIAVPEGGSLRLFLRTLELKVVKAQLLRNPAALIFPFDGGPELHVGAEWHDKILLSFGEQ